MKRSTFHPIPTTIIPYELVNIKLNHYLDKYVEKEQTRENNTNRLERKQSS